MGSGLKDQESLQVNLVGRGGLKNVMAITDSGATHIFIFPHSLCHFDRFMAM